MMIVVVQIVLIGSGRHRSASSDPIPATTATTHTICTILTFSEHILDRDRGFAHGKGLSHKVLALLARRRLQLLVLVELAEYLLHRAAAVGAAGLRYKTIEVGILECKNSPCILFLFTINVGHPVPDYQLWG